MTPVIFINCKDYPFLKEIISGQKWYETRTSNTLRQFAGQRVLLAETGKGHPVIRCSAIIHTALTVTNPRIWETFYRELACIPKGSKYDWQPDTKVKFCYYIDNIRPITPGFVPEGKRHGRIWMECDNLANINTIII